MMKFVLAFNCLFLAFLLPLQAQEISYEDRSGIRVASYNVSCYRNVFGQLANDLRDRENKQLKKHRCGSFSWYDPDILALMEFDYEQSGMLLDEFQRNFLGRSQSGNDPIEYKYSYVFETNTGVLARRDLSGDGEIKSPDDCFGFGRYPGQYGFALCHNIPLKKMKSEASGNSSGRICLMPYYQKTVMVKAIIPSLPLRCFDYHQKTMSMHL